MNHFSFLLDWCPVFRAAQDSRWMTASLLLMSLLGTTSHAQVTPSAGQSYVIEQTPRTAQATVDLSSNYANVPATVSYLDGLGRPLQTVQVRGAGNAGTDIVTNAMSYDAYGRASQMFLPLPGGVGGVLQVNPQSSGQAFYGDANPYQQTVYEASPLNRPNQQWGAGQSWRSANRSQTIRYGVAPANTVLRFTVNLFSFTAYAHPEGITSSWTYFGPNDIATRTLTDEQNNQTIEYTDLQGRLIRKDVLTGSQTLTTMYVYDIFERLALVIPPKLYDWFVTGGPSRLLSFSPYSSPDPQFKDNAYVYLYDGRGRMIRKHVPSAGWTELVYDWQDRLVMSQDQQDASGPYWRYTVYDGLSRVIKTGRLSLNRSADDLRSDFTSVSNESYPSTVSPSATDQLTQNTYDDYSTSPLSYNNSGTLTTPYSTANAKGLLTSSGRRNLESGAWYPSAFWYDDKGRIVQQQRQNHLGGTDRTDLQYQFDGVLTQSIYRHQKTGSSGVIPVTTTYTSDHLDRRTGLAYQYNTDASRTLALYLYDGIGRLAQKGLEANTQSAIITRSTTPANPTLDVASQYVDVTPSNFNVNNGGNTSGLYDARIGLSALQVLDYRYHIRGWLRGINIDATGQPMLNALRNDVFAFGLDYETAGYYDGNIGRQRWLGSRQSSQTRQYTYSYDGASRLTGAVYSGASGENYSLSGMSYDFNGNIQTLTRTGIDQLSYSYAQGNSLIYVSDASGNSAGFNDGNSSGSDYTYWPDGSLKQDLNRGINQIDYNLLKLPRQISFSNGRVITYQYDATGQKLSMSSAGGGSTAETRDYIGTFQYLNGNLFEISHEEGRVSLGSSNVYEYFHRDHLSNIRAVISSNGSGGVNVSQWVDYDPWGLELSGLSNGSSTNRNRFTGKESLVEVGIGMLDYGARLYDATIGRWGVVDPLAEVSRRWSGYHYGYDNPVRIIDPDGMAGRDAFGNVTFNGYADIGPGGYVTGSVESDDNGPGKGKATTTPTPEQQRADQQARNRNMLRVSPNFRKVFAEMPIAERAEAIGGSVDAIEPDNATNFAIGGLFSQALSSIVGRFFQQAIQSSGSLVIEAGGTFSESELYAADYLKDLGKDVILRMPQGTRAAGGTSDLLVNGVRYDVYTPTTSNPSRIISAITKKNTQAEGIVLDLSKTSVTPADLGNVLRRVQGAGAKNIQDIIIINSK